MTLKDRIANARSLAIGPILEPDDCDRDKRYYIGYAADKIATFEKNDGIPPRVIANFPPTADGRIAAERFVDDLNGDPIGDDDLSSEKNS